MASNPPKSVWYNSDFADKDIPEETKDLLAKYSHIPHDQQAEHILKLREKAFARFPYPCIGQFRFLLLTLSAHPKYAEILERIKQGGNYLDAGACFGQDIRKLVADGAPSANTFAFDVDGPLQDIGYDLFRDRDTLKTTFLVRDVFDTAADWSALTGKMDVIHASAFIHLFDRPAQIKVVKLLASLTRSPGAMIVGRQMGSLKPGLYPALEPGSMMFRHDMASFQQLWDDAGAEMGMKWKVEGSMDLVGLGGFGKSEKKPQLQDENARRQLFTVTRLT